MSIVMFFDNKNITSSFQNSLIDEKTVFVYIIRELSLRSHERRLLWNKRIFTSAASTLKLVRGRLRPTSEF